MNSLSCGERVVRCLTGDDIDRVPFGVGIGWFLWGETLEKWKKESGRNDLDPARELGFEKSFINPAMESGPFPHFEHQVLEKTPEFEVTRDWRGITMRNRRDGGSMPEFLNYPVKTPEDWERLKNERYSLDGDSLDRRITQNWNEFRLQIKQSGEAVQVGTFPWGVFGTARDILGAEELLISFISEPEMIKDIMLHMTKLWLGIWERAAREVRIDHIHIWEDMSGRNGSLISPAMVEEFMMPCYDMIADFAKAHNVRIVSVDTDGDCSELVPLMMKHGINMFFPFEVQAGNCILDYRRKYPKLGIMGGLDKRALEGGKSEVDVEIEKAEAMISIGRYIPMFDHLIPPDAKWKNFKYASEKIKETCMSKTRRTKCL